MNNNYIKFAFVGIVCAAFCTATFAAPKGGSRGNHGGNGRPAKTVHQAARPEAKKPVAAKPARTAQVGRPAAKKPSTGKHGAPARHVSKPAVARHEHASPKPRHHAPPPRAARHHVPSHARYCAKPVAPAWRIGALCAWRWIEQEWMIVENGVYYYGDGYYYDGYNYYYNGAYHMAPPMPIYV